MALCTRCENFDIQSFSNGFFFRTYHLSAVETAGSNGCSFCNLLLETLKVTPGGTSKMEEFRALLRRPSPLLIHFWVERRKDGSAETQGLQITHLCAGIARSWWNLGETTQDSMSFHTMANPG
jgi:hypothetical protein